MITLILLHPFQSVPVQSWSFEDQDSVIRIGRATDNNVVLYSAVVSRYHIELRRRGAKWEIFNFGTNGTYIDGKAISQAAVIDGMIIHLARSGPKILIRLGKKAIDELKAIAAEETIAQQVSTTPTFTKEVIDSDITITPLASAKELPPKTEMPQW